MPVTPRRGMASMTALVQRGQTLVLGTKQSFVGPVFAILNIVTKTFHLQTLCAVELLITDVIRICAIDINSTARLVAAVLAVQISITPILGRDAL